jgi:exportin-T
MLLRNTLQARGQEAVAVITATLAAINCPENYATQLIQSLRAETSRDFRKTFADFCKALRT